MYLWSVRIFIPYHLTHALSVSEAPPADARAILATQRLDISKSCLCFLFLCICSFYCRSFVMLVYFRMFMFLSRRDVSK